MNVDINMPQVVVLRKAVADKLGMTPRQLPDFAIVAETISSAVGERLSASTMERFWQYSTRSVSNVAEHTLDVLSRYIGCKSWHDFLQTHIKNMHPDSGFISGDIIDIADLVPDMRLQLAWVPDRELTVRYLGKNKFVVERSTSGSIHPGDTFECLGMQKGLPLYLDRFRRGTDAADAPSARYVIGRDTGLTALSILKD